MKVYFAPAFLRAFKKLDPPVKRNVKSTISKIIDLYESGKKSAGLGVKQLRGIIWEARSGLKIRVVFTLKGDTLTFVLAANHDEVKKYLKNA